MERSIAWVGAAAWGATVWVVLGAGRSGNGVGLALFVVVSAASAAAVVNASRLSPRMVGLASIAGPIALAHLTVDRGDGDGLWSIIYLYLLSIGALIWLVADRAARAARPRRPLRPAVLVVVAAGAVIAATVSAVFLLPQRPFAHTQQALAATAAAFDVPAGFEDEGIEVSGHPLEDGRGPLALRTWRTTLTFSEACPRFERAVRQQVPGLGRQRECSFAGRQEDVWIEARLDAGETWSTATIVVREPISARS